MEDKELVECLNLTLKRSETILFSLIVVINRLICIIAICGLDTFRIERFLAKKGVLSSGALGLNNFV